MSGKPGRSGKGSGGPGLGQGPPNLGRNIRMYCTKPEKKLVLTVRETNTSPVKLIEELKKTERKDD